jgi:hypothetical protein
MYEAGYKEGRMEMYIFWEPIKILYPQTEVYKNSQYDPSWNQRKRYAYNFYLERFRYIAYSLEEVRIQSKWSWGPKVYTFLKKGHAIELKELNSTGRAKKKICQSHDMKLVKREENKTLVREGSTWFSIW